MKLLRSLTLCFVLLSSFAAYSKDGGSVGKDFTGIWLGYLNVTANGQQIKLPFAMEIEKGDYGQYGGHCKLAVNFPDEGQKYIDCKISGMVSMEQFTFKDGAIINFTMPQQVGFYWCTKTGTLHFTKGSKGEDMLTGPVSGYSPKGDCLPAVAELWRDNK